MISSIFFFAVTVYLMGLAVVQLATGRYRVDFETQVMCTGVGLATFAVSVSVLHLLGFSLSWWTLLAAAFVLFMLGALRDILAKKGPKPAEEQVPFWTKDSWYLAGAILLAAVLFAVYLNGAFTSKWLIDDDSWDHAASSTWVAIRHSFSLDVTVRMAPGNASYLEPYPPAYAVLMGALHQLRKDSIFWVLKFYNALIISMGLVYFYVMMRTWTKRPRASLWMTAMLWICPCFMSNFIWSQTLALVCIFPVFWAFERARTEPRWGVVGAVAAAGVCMTQPSTAAVFAAMLMLWWGVHFVRAKRGAQGAPPVRRAVVLGVFAAVGVLGSALFYLPAYLKFGHADFFKGMAKTQGVLPLKVSGAGRGIHYGLWDFISAPVHNRINQPTGFGLMLFALVVAGLVLLIVRWKRTRASAWRLVTLAWLGFAVVGVLAEYLPVSLFPHRFWAFLAIPAAILAGLFLDRLHEVLGMKRMLFAVSLGVCLGLLLVSYGVGEALSGEAAPEIAGWRLLSVLLAGVASLGVLIAGLYTLIQEEASERTWWVSASTAVLLAGLVLTSGYPKARFQGFSEWDPGQMFYHAFLMLDREGEPMVESDAPFVTIHGGAPVMFRDDRVVPLPPAAKVVPATANHVNAFVRLREALRQQYEERLPMYERLKREALAGGRRPPPPPTPNPSVVGLTCSTKKLIGFDMSAMPFDLGVLKFREALDGALERLLTLEQAGGEPQEIERLKEGIVSDIRAQSVSENAIRLVAVDYENAAYFQRRRLLIERQMRHLMESVGMDAARLSELLRGEARPAPREAPLMAHLRELVSGREERLHEEYRAVMKARRLEKLLHDSPRFRERWGYTPYGVIIYEPMPEKDEAAS